MLVYAIKITRLQDAAEELVQEIFLKLWLHRENLHEVENAGGYIFRITASSSPIATMHCIPASHISPGFLI